MLLFTCAGNIKILFIEKANGFSTGGSVVFVMNVDTISKTASPSWVIEFFIITKN
jgi:hypothetical protein